MTIQPPVACSETRLQPRSAVIQKENCTEKTLAERLTATVCRVGDWTKAGGCGMFFTEKPSKTGGLR